MPDENVLELRVWIAASAETVYRFLSDPARFRAWMGDADFDPRAGSEMVIRHGNGEVSRGTVSSLQPGRRLEFTWGYDGHATLPPGSTRVSVELLPEPTGCTVVLRHSGLPGEAERRDHRGGWQHYLMRLEGAVLGELESAAAERCVRDYMAAWAETDPEARGALLRSCWEDDAVFADRMGRAAGRKALDDYIAAAQRFMPGAAMRVKGTPDLVRARVRFAWTIAMPDGSAGPSGVNIGELSAGGRFSRVTGFWDS